MIKTIQLMPGITLRCFPDSRFRQGVLSFQIVRPMCREEAAVNAVIPDVLLRGSQKHPDLRSITLKLDDLYGAAVGATVRRIGDYQTTGLSCGFLEDRFAMEGDRVMEPMVELLRELLQEPVTEDSGFSREYVQSEQKNLISAIDAQRNDKRTYAISRMLRLMCKADSYGIPRLGLREDAEKIDPAASLAHYRKILRESRIDLFYVGSVPAETAAQRLMSLFDGLERCYIPLPEQTPFRNVGGTELTETMDLAQGRLCLGYTTPITNRDPRFCAMQVMNAVFGAGATSKLFLNVREKQSLCYDIGSSYYGSKGLMLVCAGIDTAMEERTRQEIQRQLDAVCAGEITEEELKCARQAICSSLRSVHDSPGAIENYYATAALSGLTLTPEAYIRAIEAVTREEVTLAARTLQSHTTYFLKGEA